jgi:hypothetical protein
VVGLLLPLLGGPAAGATSVVAAVARRVRRAGLAPDVIDAAASGCCCCCCDGIDSVNAVLERVRRRRASPVAAAETHGRALPPTLGAERGKHRAVVKWGRGERSCGV